MGTLAISSPEGSPLLKPDEGVKFFDEKWSLDNLRDVDAKDFRSGSVDDKRERKAWERMRLKKLMMARAESDARSVRLGFSLAKQEAARQSSMSSGRIPSAYDYTEEIALALGGSLVSDS